jgi:hypothetical protein
VWTTWRHIPEDSFHTHRYGNVKCNGDAVYFPTAKSWIFKQWYVFNVDRFWVGNRIYCTLTARNYKSKFLRSVTRAPWYVSNFTIHNDLQIPFVIEEIHRLSTSYHQSIFGHNNRLVAEITNPPTVRRRLKRPWPSDLPQPADDKKIKPSPSLYRACPSYQWMTSLLKTPT